MIDEGRRLGYTRIGDTHIITGHVIDALKKIPDNKVQCVVTSPPYFGLRNYGTDPQVWSWGGDRS